jgi:ATP-dependent DNA ligase
MEKRRSPLVVDSAPSAYCAPSLNPENMWGLSEVQNQSAAEMLNFVKKRGLEGVVAKRTDSIYQPGQRSGLWTKHRLNLGQEFVIGGYVPSSLGVNSVIVGFYRGLDLIYSARVRAGLVPATRRELFEKIRHLETAGVLSSIFPKLARAAGVRGSHSHPRK